MKRRNIFLIVLFSVLILSGIFFWYFFSSNIKIGDVEIKSEAKTLSSRVGKHFLIPTDEVPTIATVTDPDKLKGQAFFAKAKRGYKVLIYTNARQAILYDPVIDRVVAVAPLNIDTNKSKNNNSSLEKFPAENNTDLIRDSF